MRLYRDTDLEAVVAIFTASVHMLAVDSYDALQRAAWAPLQPDLEKWRNRLAGLQTLVGIEENAVTGFISFESSGHVEFLYVSPSYARQGVASSLYACAENALVGSAVSELFTEASLVARPFFESVGFVVTGEQNEPFGGAVFSRYTMHKRVAAQQAVQADSPRFARPAA